MKLPGYYDGCHYLIILLNNTCLKEELQKRCSRRKHREIFNRRLDLLLLILSRP